MCVVHCRGNKYDVYIGRPSKWGNPFIIGRDGTRDEVVAKYEAWIYTQPQLLADLHELRGKVLGCWCAPLACHGDVLARLANQPMEITMSTAAQLLGGDDPPEKIEDLYSEAVEQLRVARNALEAPDDLSEEEMSYVIHDCNLIIDSYDKWYAEYAKDTWKAIENNT